MAHQQRLGRQPEQLRGGAGRDDDRVRLERRVGGTHDERPASEVHRHNVLGDHVRAEALRLLAHRLHQLGAEHGIDEARIVLDVRGEHQLTARLHAADHQRRQVRARRIDRRGIAGGAGADDDHLTSRRHVVASFRVL